MLADTGADGGSPDAQRLRLVIAAFGGKTAEVTKLLATGIPPDTTVRMEGDEGSAVVSALVAACSRGHRGCARALLDAKVIMPLPVPPLFSSPLLSSHRSSHVSFLRPTSTRRRCRTNARR